MKAHINVSISVSLPDSGEGADAQVTVEDAAAAHAVQIDPPSLDTALDDASAIAPPQSDDKDHSPDGSARIDPPLAPDDQGQDDWGDDAPPPVPDLEDDEPPSP